MEIMCLIGHYRLRLRVNILGIISYILIFCACSGFHGSGNNDSESTDSLTLHSDSLESIEKYIALSSASDAIEWMKESGEWNKYSAGILPQMAEDEVSYVEKLINSDKPTFIIVDKATMKIYLYDKFGREIKNYGMACSRYYGTKHKWKDNRTPEGFFSVEGIYDSTDWLYTDDDGNTSQVKGQFGPRFIRLNIPITRSIGIHGTCSPWSIGGRRSHGCIRLTNENILDLVERVEKGAPVIVSPGPYDMFVNQKEGYRIPSVSPVRGTPRAKAASYSPAKGLSSQEKTLNVEKSDSISQNTNDVEEVSAEPSGSE